MAHLTVGSVRRSSPIEIEVLGNRPPDWSPVTPQRSPRIIRNLPRRRSSPTVRSATKQRQLPAIGGDVVTQDVEIALRVLHLEVPMIGCQPAVNDFRDLDLALAEPEPSRRLLATIAGVALDIHDRERGHVSRHGLSDSP
jgi:hypothetical protein